MFSNRMPNAKQGCSIGGKCEKCPHYRSMPVDVTDPTTGKVVKQGTAWDCVFYWMMLGSWDAGRQSQGVHAAVNKHMNEACERQDRFLSLVEGANRTQRLNHAAGED